MKTEVKDEFATLYKEFLDINYNFLDILESPRLVFNVLFIKVKRRHSKHHKIGVVNGRMITLIHIPSHRYNSYFNEVFKRQFNIAKKILWAAFRPCYVIKSC